MLYILQLFYLMANSVLPQAFEHALQSLRSRDNDGNSTLAGTRSEWLPGAGRMTLNMCVHAK
jgi:hypothetical protein